MESARVQLLRSGSLHVTMDDGVAVHVDRRGLKVPEPDLISAGSLRGAAWRSPAPQQDPPPEASRYGVYTLPEVIAPSPLVGGSPRTSDLPLLSMTSAGLLAPRVGSQFARGGAAAPYSYYPPSHSASARAAGPPSPSPPDAPSSLLQQQPVLQRTRASIAAARVQDAAGRMRAAAEAHIGAAKQASPQRPAEWQADADAEAARAAAAVAAATAAGGPGSAGRLITASTSPRVAELPMTPPSPAPPAFGGGAGDAATSPPSAPAPPTVGTTPPAVSSRGSTLAQPQPIAPPTPAGPGGRSSSASRDREEPSSWLRQQHQQGQQQQRRQQGQQPSEAPPPTAQGAAIDLPSPPTAASLGSSNGQQPPEPSAPPLLPEPRSPYFPLAYSSASPAQPGLGPYFPSAAPSLTRPGQPFALIEALAANARVATAAAEREQQLQQAQQAREAQLQRLSRDASPRPGPMRSPTAAGVEQQLPAGAAVVVLTSQVGPAEAFSLSSSASSAGAAAAQCSLDAADARVGGDGRPSVALSPLDSATLALYAMSPTFAKLSEARRQRLSEKAAGAAAGVGGPEAEPSPGPVGARVVVAGTPGDWRRLLSHLSSELQPPREGAGEAPRQPGLPGSQGQPSPARAGSGAPPAPVPLWQETEWRMQAAAAASALLRASSASQQQLPRSATPGQASPSPGQGSGGTAWATPFAVGVRPPTAMDKLHMRLKQQQQQQQQRQW